MKVHPFSSHWFSNLNLHHPCAEVFVDADGSNQFYKEFEINALNATWDLTLNRPYADDGYENSTRTFGKKGWAHRNRLL